MSIGTNYAHPVNVNGYSCKNCTDVDYAKKHIDPAHPKSGPYGVNADSDLDREKAIQFAGALTGAQGTSVQRLPPVAETGRTVNVLV